MRSAHTVAQIRAAEAASPELASGALMQRAAHGLAHAVLHLLGGGYGRRALLLVGSGDNGADALYAGRQLARRGALVDAVLLGDRVHDAALAAFRQAGGRVLPGPPVYVSPSGLRRTARPDVVVDGVVGIGGRPGLRDHAAAVVAALPVGVPVVAVDLPSGLEADTGRVEARHVTADLTVTFGSLKPVHLVDPAASACGVVRLVDIGLDLPPAAMEALESADVAALLPVPGGAAHKYTRGVVGVRAGSTTYPGAAHLSVGGAVSGLAGMVRFRPVDDDEDVVRAVVAEFPEVVATTGEGGRVQAWVVGSGGGEGADAALAQALASGVPLVVDADALSAVRDPLGVPAVLTPHAGELAAMLGRSREEVEADSLAHAREAAARFDAVVVLKGRRTLVAEPGGQVRVNTTGTPWLATAGAGDVLAGLTGALLAAGLPAFDAASVACWLHGEASLLASAGGPVRASDVARRIPDAVRSVLDER